MLPVRLFTFAISVGDLLSKHGTQAVVVSTYISVCCHLSVTPVAVLGVRSLSELLCEEYFEYLEREN